VNEDINNDFDEFLEENKDFKEDCDDKFEPMDETHEKEIILDIFEPRDENFNDKTTNMNEFKFWV